MNDILITDSRIDILKGIHKKLYLHSFCQHIGKTKQVLTRGLFSEILLKIIKDSRSLNISVLNIYYNMHPGTSRDIRVNDVSIVNLVQKQFFAIVSLDASESFQQEYKIFFGKDMFKCTNFKEGNPVKARYGDEIREGTIVKISKEELYLKHNFDEFIKVHEECIKQKNMPITIGSNGTSVTKDILDSIDWGSYEKGTRGLLTAVFSREVLATHSLTGKILVSRPNLPDDMNMPILDPKIISDVVEFITTRYGVPETKVRLAISKKCFNERVSYDERLQEEMQ